MLIILYLCLSLGIYFIYSTFFLVPLGIETVSIPKEFDLKIHDVSPRYRPRQRGFLDILGYINIPLLKIIGLSHYYTKLINKADLKITPLGFFALKELTLLFSLPLSGYLNLGFSFTFLVVLAGTFIPDLWLWVRINQHREKMLRVLPETVDLLSLCISAGLDFVGGLKWITEAKISFKSPFITELVRVKEEINLGNSKAQALTNMEKRLNIPEISSLVRTLTMAEKLGISISQALDNFSQDNREKRFHRGERKARMAAIKILFPLIFFVLPTIGIIIVGPILLQFMQQGIAGF